MDNSTSRQNDAANQPTTQASVTRTIDGVYRQRNNFYRYTPESNNYLNSPKQPNNSPTPSSNSYQTTSENQINKSIYQQQPTFTQDNKKEQTNISKPYPDIKPLETTSHSENVNSQYLYNQKPNFRTNIPIETSQSVDGIKNTPLPAPIKNTISNNPSIQQETPLNISANFSNTTVQPNKAYNNQSQTNIADFTQIKNNYNESPKSPLKNQPEPVESTIHNQRANYATNTKVSKITYLDIINTVLLVFIMFIAILILIKVK